MLRETLGEGQPHPSLSAFAFSWVRFDEELREYPRSWKILWLVYKEVAHTPPEKVHP